MSESISLHSEKTFAEHQPLSRCQKAFLITGIALSLLSLVGGIIALCGVFGIGTVAAVTWTAISGILSIGFVGIAIQSMSPKKNSEHFSNIFEDRSQTNQTERNPSTTSSLVSSPRNIGWDDSEEDIQIEPLDYLQTNQTGRNSPTSPLIFSPRNRGKGKLEKEIRNQFVSLDYPQANQTGRNSRAASPLIFSPRNRREDNLKEIYDQVESLLNDPDADLRDVAIEYIRSLTKEQADRVFSVNAEKISLLKSDILHSLLREGWESDALQHLSEDQVAKLPYAEIGDFQLNKIIPLGQPSKVAVIPKKCIKNLANQKKWGFWSMYLSKEQFREIDIKTIGQTACVYLFPSSENMINHAKERLSLLNEKDKKYVLSKMNARARKKFQD